MNDVETMSKYIKCNSDSMRKLACRNLFTLVCTLAMQTVIAGDRTKKQDMWVKLKQSFDDVINNYPMTSDSGRVLAYFDNGWPVMFINFVVSKFNGAITAKFRKELEKDGRAASDDLQRMMYMGHLIELEVEECKRYINNVLNPLFNEKNLPSGRSMQQLLNAIRRNIWCTECVKKARKSAYQKIGYTKKSGENQSSYQKT